MYRYSREIGRMASQLGVNYQMAVGIFAIMKERDKDGDLDSISSGVFWMELGGKIRGQTKESLIRLYVEVNVGQKRKKEREKKDKYFFCLHHIRILPFAMYIMNYTSRRFLFQRNQILEILIIYEILENSDNLRLE